MKIFAGTMAIVGAAIGIFAIVRSNGESHQLPKIHMLTSLPSPIALHYSTLYRFSF